MTKKTYRILGNIIAVLELLLLIATIICLGILILDPETIIGLRIFFLIVEMMAVGSLSIAFYQAYLEVKKENKNGENR